MKRALAIVGLLGVLVLASCTTIAPTANQPTRTPLQTAEIAYVQGSIFYEAAMTAVQQFRAQRLVTDDQWERVDRAQQIVRQYSSEYSELLALWQTTKQKPERFDLVELKVKGAGDEVALVLAEVQR